MSRKGKKTANKDDEMWEKKEKELEKKRRIIQQDSLEEEDRLPQQKKFEFRFANQKEFLKKEREIRDRQVEREKLLRQIQQQEEELQKEQRPDPSDADLAEKADRRQRQKAKKQQKQRLKQQRKQVEKIRTVIEEERKAQEKKIQNAVEADMKLRKQGESRDGVKIVLGLLVFVLLAGYLQYKGEVHQRYEVFRTKNSEDLYALLQADSGLSDQQLKQRYKKLALKYHPDKNKDCKDCKQHFTKIIKAWEILGNSEKRQEYDSTNGAITKIKSKSITLTPQNYYQEVQSSNDLWIIQVYDSTSTYCHHYSQFWEDIVGTYGGFAKFGRVDYWSQQDMKPFIPYSFRIFPSIYSVRKDKSGDLYSMQTRNPIDSLKNFVQKELSRQVVGQKVTEEQFTAELRSFQKPIVLLGNQPNYQLNSILLKYDSHITTRILKNSESLKIQRSEARVYYSVDNFDHYSLKTLDDYLSFSTQLPKYFVQEMNLCQVIKYCENSPCLILLNPNIVQPKSLYPQIIVADGSIQESVEWIKNKTGMPQKFQLAIYLNGKMDLGYIQDLGVMNVEEGELVQLKCTPPLRIPYLLLCKVAGLILGAVYTSSRKVQITLGVLLLYTLYNSF